MPFQPDLYTISRDVNISCFAIEVLDDDITEEYSESFYITLSTDDPAVSIVSDKAFVTINDNGSNHSVTLTVNLKFDTSSFHKS